MVIATYVVFRTAGRHCAIAREEVRQILPLPLLQRPLGLPDAIEGVFDLAGAATSVLRLDRLFGFAASPLHAYQHLILLAKARSPTALLVDQVTQVMRPSESDVVPLSGGETFNGCVIGQIGVDTDAVHVLSVASLLTEREKALLVEFQAVEQRRLASVGYQP